ncbi:ABC transporter ATP-binding protein [uncultured Adlercreutzia sp.]|uniref:ABC transporter ATP-binding protein n=1 Tax=uncultured Adlercreutzia sp. TaxID=875803 RepID=UPI0025E71ECA|nr:ABC transporter ATP-binding protein [uncultured Adlercreutzia sp.]MCI9261312.1 ABC transporter ATP-binding protein [Eggerthellaceae bacterium]
MAALTCENLSRSFWGKRVVDGVSLTLAPGDIYGLVGRNGAGKSTLLKMLAGYLAPSSGAVEIYGEALGPCQTSAHLGCLIEQPAVNPSLSAFQNVMVRALAQGLPDAKDAAVGVLRAVGLDPAERDRAGHFSLGMKQRLGLALTLIGEPEVLLLDEPFNGLDPEGVRLVRELLVNLAETRQVAVLISSHVLDQLDRMATRYGVIREGKLVCEMTADQVAAECADYLCVETPDAPRALAVLQQRWPEAAFAVMPDDAIRIGAVGEVETPGSVVDTGVPTAEEVGRVLLAADVPVSGLYIRSRDIEEYFVTLMGGTAPVRGKGASGDLATPMRSADDPSAKSAAEEGGDLHA